MKCYKYLVGRAGNRSDKFYTTPTSPTSVNHLFFSCISYFPSNLLVVVSIPVDSNSAPLFQFFVIRPVFGLTLKAPGKKDGLRPCQYYLCLIWNRWPCLALPEAMLVRRMPQCLWLRLCIWEGALQRQRRSVVCSGRGF